MTQSGRLKLRSRDINDVHIVDLEGDLTMGKEAALLREHLRKHLDAGGRHLVLQMEKIAFMDSSGVGVLVEIKAHALNLNGDIRLCGCPSFVTRLLFRLALHRILEVYDSEEAVLLKW